MDNFRNFVCSLFNCTEDYDKLLKNLQDCREKNDNLNKACLELARELEKCEELIPRPTPPDITYVTEATSAWVHNKLMALEPSIIHLGLDVTYYLTNKTNFLNIIAWDWVDTWEYVREKFDCENFAIAFKSHVDRYFGLNQVGIIIDYKAGHGYNIVIFPDGKVMLIEPQSDRLFYWEDAADILYVLKKAYVMI